MEILKDRYTITELSGRLQITDHALRYYEKEFNIKVPKDSRGRRYYTPELANLMYKIKTMRSEGLEIKAIKKIFDSENIAVEPPPVVIDDSSVTLVPVSPAESQLDIRQFFDEFKVQLTNSMAAEVSSAKEYISREIYKTKLELGACVENSSRKLEHKLDRHFSEIDRLIGVWREKKKGNAIKRFFKKVL